MKNADLIFNGISKETLGMWFHRQDDALTEAGSRSGFVHRNSAWERTCDGKLVEGCEDMERVLQNKQTFSQNEVETLMRGRRLSCHEHLACANGDLYRPIAPGVVVSFDKKQIVPGTEWAPLRSVTPKHELLQNENLTRALQNKKSFSEAEIADMNLSEVKQKHYVQCGVRRLRPIITNPGSKMFGVFETKDLVQELLSQHQGHCFFYEVILNRDTCLYFDLEGEFPSEKGLTLDEARDVLLGTVKQVCGALKTFCAICKIECSDKIQLLESSRQKPDGSMKASFHMIIKSLHFKSNVESGLMEFFVYAIKHLIGDTEDYIDVAVYTQMRNLRILGSEKRLLGDHGSGKLKKVNIGETMEIQYDLDDRNKRDMTPEDYQDKMRIDLERSLVSNVYPESILVTAEHVCAFEEYVERARVGLQWEKCKVAAQKGNVKIESQFLKDILGRRHHLTRAELDQVCTEIGDFVSSKASVVVGNEGEHAVFRPVVHNSKRFMNFKGGKQKVSKRTVVQVATPSTDLEPVLKTAKVDNGQMPVFAQKIFCGATTRIKPITTDQYDLFHYAKDCIELQVLREENIKKFYIENPARCPIDWCTGCRKGEPHKSNNCLMYVIKRDDREESEVFMFCLDKQCRDSHAQAFSGVFSPYGICNMQTASFPSIFTRSDDKTLLQKYFMTPFSFKNITDGERREKLLRILMKSPTEIRKLMTGPEYGRSNLNMYRELLGSDQWVKIPEEKTGCVLGGRQS